MNLVLSSSPHLRDNASTPRIMGDVLIALAPALLASALLFGLRPLAVAAVAVAFAVGSEYLFRRLVRRSNTIGDLSAAVTGLLLALNLPPTIPLWIAALGSVVAIVIVKQFFGGIGQNFVNPALAARVVLAISFPVAMTRWDRTPGLLSAFGIGEADVVTGPTLLEQMRQGAQGEVSLLSLFLGLDKGGCIGEISVAALLLGAAWLVFRKVIPLWTPLSYLAVVGLFTLAAGRDPLVHLMSGGLVIGAFFMATDYATVPLTWKGQLLFGLGCGLITSLIRLFGGMARACPSRSCS